MSNVNFQKSSDVNSQLFGQLLKEALLKDQNALATNNKMLKEHLFEEALELSKKTLAMDHKNSKAWRTIARAFLHQKKFTKALQAYQKGIVFAKKSELHYLMNGIGNVYRYMAYFNKQSRAYLQRAVSFYVKSLRSSPLKTRGLYLANLAAAYASLQEWDEAIKAAEQALILLKKEESNGITHGNQRTILELEIKLYQEYKKRTLE